jgi:DeoR/GlpR family transcriptional regulator of sugar metabolism
VIRSRRRLEGSIFCEILEGRQLLSGLAQDVQQLVKELQTIHAGSSVTPTEIKAVTNDFASIAAVATKPSAASVATLEGEIKVVVAHGSLTPSEIAALEKDGEAVLASANVPQSLVQQTSTDLKVILVSSGITKAELKTVGADVKAILTDLESLKR